MNVVTFPEFNVIFHISKVAFSIKNIDIYWYAVCIVFGITMSLILASKTKENFGIDFEDLLEIIVYALILGIIGARLYYVIFKLEYYLSNPTEILNIRDGGLAIYGGIITGIILIYIICKHKKINTMDLFDYICPYVALSQAIGRFGNFFNVEAYGIETNIFTRMGINSNAGYIEVHPCFLYEFIACIIIFFILRIFQKKRMFKGQIFSWYLILYGICRFFIERIRIDSLMLFNLKISQIISILFVILGIVIVQKCRKKSNYAIQKNLQKSKKY